MRITVIGCGRWGSLIAWYLDRTGHAVTLYGRPGSRHMQRFLATRRNDLLELPESIRLSTDLSWSPAGGDRGDLHRLPGAPGPDGPATAPGPCGIRYSSCA